MPGVVFDRAASFYDATRGYPPGVDAQLRDAIVGRLGLGIAARIVEPAIGTGRIALPFLRAGYRYVGVDLSAAMLQELPRKLGEQAARARLIVGDVMHMPLLSRSFDLAILVHVLHLVADWQRVLDEVGRVLRPGGTILLANDAQQHNEPPTPPEQVWPAWAAILDQLGVLPEQRRAGAVRGLDERFVSYLQQHGFQTRRVTLLEYRRAPETARMVVARYRDRIYSSCWSLPDTTHAEASRLLEQWLASECSEPDRPYAIQSHVEAVVAVAG